MGKHRDDGSGHIEGDLFEKEEDKGPRNMERDSGGVQGFEYFGPDTRDQEGNK